MTRVGWRCRSLVRPDASLVRGSHALIRGFARLAILGIGLGVLFRALVTVIVLVAFTSEALLWTTHPLARGPDAPRSIRGAERLRVGQVRGESGAPDRTVFRVGPT